MATIKQPTDAQVENARKRLQLTMSQVFDLMRKYAIRYNQLREYLIEKAPEIGDGSISSKDVEREISASFVPLVRKLNKGSSFLAEESEKQLKDRLEVAYKNYLNSDIIKNKTKLSHYMVRFLTKFKAFANEIKTAGSTSGDNLGKATIYNFARILAKPSLDEPYTNFEDLPVVQNKIGRYRPKDILTLIKVLEAYNKELKKHYMIFYRIKPTTPDIPTTDIIPESFVREKVLKEMKIRIKESARMRNLPQGPLSQDLVARLTSIDNEFLDYYRRFLTIYNKMREIPDNIKTDSNTDQLAIDFVTNLFADLNQPLNEEDMPIPKWKDIDDRYKMLYVELQNLIDLEDNFDEAKAKENINFFKREYQKFLTMLSSIAQSGKIGDQTLKINEVKRLIKQELKVLNGKKMVRN